MTNARTRGPSVEDLYTRGRPNSLNFIRLILASAVILFHSYAVLGAQYPEGGYARLLGNFPVNGFFAISGFLIYRSWVNRPVVSQFLLARVVRIYPAFWVCLLVTAFLFAPVAVAVQGGDPWKQAFSVESLTYVVKNASLAMLQWRIGDTPADIPFITSWNASLWTLAWEFACYIGLMCLGVLGMARRKWMLPFAFAASVAINVLVLLPLFDYEVLARVARFSIFFLAGALVAQCARRLPASWLLAVAAALIALASAWLPVGSFIVQAPAAAVALVLLGGKINPRWAELKNDISYGVYIYAFPVQQILVILGFSFLGLYGLSVVALVLTIPLAAASWFLVEKPSLKLRKVLTRDAPALVRDSP